MSPYKKIKDPFLCFLSAGLLALAFPTTNLWFLAWIGLIPLMIALDGKSYAQAFRTGWLCGGFFFIFTFHWFFHLTAWFSYIIAVGIALLIAYLALYFGLFGLGYRYFRNRSAVVRLLVIASFWVVLEYIRDHLFSGFGWASLGYSQYRILPIIQIADITGMFGVSFLLMMVNLSLKEFFFSNQPKSKSIGSLAVTGVLLIVILGYGFVRLNQEDTLPTRPVAIIQGNIPQELKWDYSSWSMIMERYQKLTRQAVKENPELLIWPETSFPGILWQDKDLYDELVEFVKEVQTPLLFGAVLREGNDYYNATVFLSKQGEVKEIYRKVHLVPFGEYLPLRNVIPFLSDIVPIDDFSSGKKHTVFSFPSSGNGEGRFSVLTCFEDTVSRLARRSVKNGAQLLVNLTNDAWFKDSIAPFLHLQSSVFRTVENRRALVRSANTGVSCMIDRYGRIMDQVKGSNGKVTYVSGYTVAWVNFNTEETFFTKWGDIFVYLCFGCILAAVVMQKLRYKEF